MTVVAPAGAVVGHIAVPGDKSVSHRSVLIGAISEGETLVRGFGRSADTEATIGAVRALGVDVIEDDADALRVRGLGLRGLAEPAAAIDCANAGTLVRLLSGILAGQADRSFALVGDESLSARPMGRIADPLRLLGAEVETSGGTLPIRIRGRALRGIEYRPPVASAQVKSAVLLAGLYAEGRTTVIEPIPTRDHTELMLEAAGARVVRRPGSVSVEGGGALYLPEVFVPGDFSSAAPFLVAATLIAGSELTIHDVGLNPRRTGLLDVLGRMGGRVTVFNRRRIAGEQIGDLEVRSAELTATEIGPDEVPGLIDELPLFAVLAAHAHGESVVRGAEELRTKESDRIDAVTTGLRALGVHITAMPDGYRVRGVPARPRGGGMRSAGDHRIAMVGAVAGLASREGVEIEDADAVAVSFPGFFELLDSISRR
jgi:3-phosphoshikimate 1-carboxyvinyltransferase